MARKATDVLLSIEGKLSTVLGHCRNQELLIKTLVGRIEKLEAKLAGGVPAPAKQQPVQSKPQEPSNVNKQIPGLKPSVQLKSNQLVRSKSEDNEEEGLEEKLEVESTHVGKRRDVRYFPVSDSKGKQIPVQQKMLYADGRAITMAKVELFDSEGKLFKTLKTNATGKWTSAVPAGFYTVKLSKKGTSKKDPVEVQTDVNIPNSDEPVQLRPYQMEE